MMHAPIKRQQKFKRIFVRYGAPSYIIISGEDSIKSDRIQPINFCFSGRLR
jgi:hypothetical protein